MAQITSILASKPPEIVFVMTCGTSITTPFLSDRMVSNSGVQAIPKGALVMPVRHWLSDGASMAISTTIGPGVCPNRISID